MNVSVISSLVNDCYQRSVSVLRCSAGVVPCSCFPGTDDSSVPLDLPPATVLFENLSSAESFYSPSVVPSPYYLPLLLDNVTCTSVPCEGHCGTLIQPQEGAIAFQ